MSPQVPTVVADPDGDTLLLLSPEAVNQFTPVTYKLKILCSSKHLSLASPIFKAMLNPVYGFQEGRTLSTLGKVEIPLPEDDPDTMKCVILIIHNRHYHPDARHATTLDFLCKIAIVIDKYQMQEAFGYYTQVKAAKYFYQHKIADHEFKDYLSMLCITWVFELDENFEQITRYLEEHTKGSIVDLLATQAPNLPIPAGVIQKMETARVAAIGATLQVLHNKITNHHHNIISGHLFCKVDPTQFSDPNKLKSHRERCDATMLDSLKSTSRKASLWPLPIAHHAFDSSVKDIMEAVRSLELQNGCEGFVEMPAFLGWPYRSDHGIRQSIQYAVRNIEINMYGLDLLEEKERFEVKVMEQYR